MMRDDLTAALRLDPDRKRALLAQLLQREGTARGPAPLSFPQRRLWLIDQIEPNAPTYNVAYAWRLRGALDAGALERSLTEIVRRHEILRSVITLVDGEPLQRVREAAPVPLSRVDLHDDADRLSAVLGEESRRPFDLTKGPLIRTQLVRLSPNDHALSVTMHHIVTDGWSMGVFERELAALYGAFSAGAASPLAAPRRQYADFARLQRRSESSAAIATQRAYWKEQLAGAPMALALPGAGGAAAPSPQGADLVRMLPAALSGELLRVGRAAGTTRFPVLLAAFAALIARTTEARDIVVGTPIANRTRAEFEDVIGFFVNTLPLRIKLDGDPAFAALLRSVNDVALSAYDNQDVPFDRVIEDLPPARRHGGTPLVNVMFVLQSALGAPPVLGDLKVTPIALEAAGAKFDAIFELTETPAGLRLRVNYRTDGFSAGAIDDLCSRYEALLHAVVRDPAAPISRLGPRRPAPATTMVVAEEPLDGRRVHDVFAAVAAGAPERIAVQGGGAPLTYGELDRRAGALARRLQALGTQHGDTVGVALERSADTVVAFLAILKAGAAYVPLDPEYPHERIAQMTGDAGVRTVVTRPALRGCLAAARGIRIVDIERDLSRDTAVDDAPLRVPGDANDAAYVMYTSGSTGRPKGVIVPHRGIRRLVTAPNYVRLGPDDTVAQASTVAFDAATFEIWGALLNGARLTIVPKAVLLDPRELAAAIARESITVCFLTTSLFTEIVRAQPTALRGVRTLLIGGEALPVAAVRQLFAAGAPARVVNIYGPTETTTFASFHEIVGSPPAGVPIPTGRPISHTQVYVLDEHRKPVPAGGAGELYIGGPGVALGYVRDPELTRRKFVRIAGVAPEALYATGDRVRHNPAGELEFLGRTDGQLKIRGFRIEPGEIETALREIRGIADARVVLRDRDTPPKLVAYVVAEPGGRVDDEQTLRRLRERLPAFMLPDAVVELAALPLTASGKLDRDALPAPMAGGSRHAEAAVPRSELEQQVALVWERLLGVQRVGRDDDFFELGGHSLLAVAMIAEIERTLGKRVPLGVVFEEPTVERIARALLEDGGSYNGRRATPLNAAGTRTPLFFLHGSLEGGGFYCHKLAAQLGTDQPLVLLRPHGVHGEPAPASIREMAAEYVPVLTELQPHGPYHLGGYCSGGLVAFEMARQLRAAGAPVASVILVDTPAPAGTLRPLVLGLERIAATLRLPQRPCAAVAAGIARLPYHWRRLRKSSSPARYLLDRVGSRSSPGGAGNVPPLLVDWTRATEAYVPGRYDRAVTVLASEDTRDPGGAGRSGWQAVARDVTVRPLAGDHFTCITEFIGETAGEIAAALARSHD